MKYLSWIVLSVLILVSITSAQKPIVNDADEIVDSIETDLIAIHVLVRSDKKGYLENLTSKNFEIHYKKATLEIDNSLFEAQKKYYVVLFYPDDSVKDFNWRKVKIKVKLSREERNEYGDVSVEKINGHHPNQN